MKKSVLVTGASGFIGRRLCTVLQEQGHHVVALGRHPQTGPWDEFRQGDLAGNLPKDVCDGIDSVFHLAGFAHAMRLPRGQQGIYQQINVEGTRALLARVRDSQVKRLVYFSSIKAMADPGEDCVDERFTQPPSDAYGLSKLNAEQAVLAFGVEHAVHVCCLRPTLVYGRNPKGNIQRMLQAIRQGRFPPLPRIDNRRSMISVNDLVAAALLASELPQANGKVYVAGDAIGALSVRPAPFSSETLQRLFGSACYKNDRIVNELQWSARDSLEDVLPDMLAENEIAPPV